MTVQDHRTTDPSTPDGVLDVRALMESEAPGLWPRVAEYFCWSMAVTPGYADQGLEQVGRMLAASGPIRQCCSCRPCLSTSSSTPSPCMGSSGPR
jgi:hypothetical protein